MRNLLPSRALWLCIGLGFSAALAGCSHSDEYYLRRTEEFYRPAKNAKVYPPKPKDADIPLYVYVPGHRKYKVIGRFYMVSYGDFYFSRQAAVYNARRVGADTVLIKEQWTGPSYSYVYFPHSTTTWVDVPNPQSKEDAKAGKDPGTHQESSTDLGPPETGTGYYNYFDGEMIVYK